MLLGNASRAQEVGQVLLRGPPASPAGEWDGEGGEEGAEDERGGFGDALSRGSTERYIATRHHIATQRRVATQHHVATQRRVATIAGATDCAREP